MSTSKTATINFDAVIEASKQNTKMLKRQQKAEARAEKERQEKLLARGLVLISRSYLFTAITNGVTVDSLGFEKAAAATTSAKDLEAISFAKENPEELKAMIEKLSQAVERRAGRNIEAETKKQPDTPDQTDEDIEFSDLDPPR